MSSPLSPKPVSNGAAGPRRASQPAAALALAAVALSLASASAVSAQTEDAGALIAPELSLIGSYALPTGLSIGGAPFGGISALDYDPETGVFWALSDDRAEFGPARFYEIKIDIRGAEERQAGVAGVDILRRVEMTDATGAAYAPAGLDPEGFRRAPGGGFYWTHERDADGAAYVGEMSAEGAAGRAYALPEYYAPVGDRGVRDNLGFESLTVDGAGRVVVALEQALKQDGPETTVEGGSLARVLVFDPATGAPVAEHVYPVEPVAARPIPSSSFKTNGLVELLSRPGGGFFALERSFSVGQGNTVKLYVADFAGADDVLGRESLAEADVAVMRKTLVLTLQAGGVAEAIDNLEAMSFGPEIDGKRTLVLMSDNNFNPFGQFTQILVFAID